MGFPSYHVPRGGEQREDSTLSVTLCPPAKDKVPKCWMDTLHTQEPYWSGFNHCFKANK